MITLSWYLLKVIICSGILCGYYFLALRNKAFHRWNRFYILAAIVISLVAPVMKINIFQNDNEKGTVVQVLQTIGYGDEAVIEYSRNNQFHLSAQNLGELAYMLVSAIFLAIFFVSLYKIKRLRKKYPETKIEDVSFINTNAKGTPFSFFNSIFWNNAIDLHSRPGKQIFNHEIAHVKEKHSYDKIFMNIVLIFFWSNPFFWLMRKELYMIHEFIADKEALEDSDVSAFAEMVLQTIYPGQKFSLNNQFFYSPLKRRIMMLAKNKNPKVSYISRLLVLPLAAIVFFAFTLKIKQRSNNLYQGKAITVIIDAGHGGGDFGASSKDGIKEKDITLSIAKKIEALNSNDHIKIILSRDDDENIPEKGRVAFAKNNNADLFISIHMNGSVNEQLNGFSVFIGRNDEVQNQLLASALIKELKESYKTEDKIAIRNKGLLVLNSSTCPAALVECGYMTNVNDAAFISKDANQENIAKNILDAINVYATSKGDAETKINLLDNKSSSISTDSIPAMHYKGKNVKELYTHLKSKKLKVTAPVIKVTFQDGNSEMISVNEAQENGILFPAKHSMIFINGKRSSLINMNRIPSSEIQSINVLEGENAIKKYGQEGEKGVIEITAKDYNAPTADTVPDIVFTKVEVTATFPGGLSAWTKYISKAIQDSISTFTNADYGTCVLRFIVNTDGKVSDVIATTMKGTKLAEVSVNAIKKGPKWIPASQNGKNVAAYRLQPVTLQNPDDVKKSVISAQQKPMAKDDGKIYTKVETEASFPGGLSAWSRYISRAIQGSIDKFTKADYGTCLIRFIVNYDGSVSDVTATTMQGTKLAEVSVHAIKFGPSWIPASQNGHPVTAYRLQPVTLINPDEKTPSIEAKENKQLSQVIPGKQNGHAVNSF